MKPIVVVTRDVNDVLNVQVERRDERSKTDLSTPVLRLSRGEAVKLSGILKMFEYNLGIRSVTEEVDE